MENRRRTYSRQQTVLNVVDNLSGKQKGEFELIVDRKNLFLSVIECLQQDGVEKKRLSIRFVIEGFHEEAFNGGGVCRELFALFFEECLNPDRRMFEGEGRVWFPTNDETAIKNRWFYCLGKAIVLSIISGGSGFPYLSHSSMDYLENEQLSEPRGDLNQKSLRFIKQIQNCESEAELSSILQRAEIRNLMKEMKWQREITFVKERIIKALLDCTILTQMQDRAEFTHGAVKWVLVDKSKPALEQLREGLNCLNFLHEALLCSDYRRFLVHDDSFCVDSRYIIDQLLPKLFELKTRDCKQEEVIQTAANCLSEIKDEEAINLFQFITGMRSLPAHNVDLRVDFNMQNAKNKLPRASTCVCLLLLPLGNKNAKEFLQSFRVALENKHGFGRI